MFLLPLLFILIKSVVCFRENSIYEYFYEGRIATGIPTIRNQVSGAGIRCNITILARKHGTLDVKLSNFEVGDYNGDVDCELMAPMNITYKEIPSHKDQLEEPFQVFLQSKEDAVMSVPRDEFLWVTNLKKSIMQHFASRPIKNFAEGNYTSGKNRNQLHYIDEEISLFGSCQTENTMIPFAKESLNKESAKIWQHVRSIDFDNCVTSVLLQRTSDVSLSEYGISQDKDLQPRSSVGVYELVEDEGGLHIERAFIEEVAIISPFGVQTDYLQMRSNQTLLLLSVRPVADEEMLKLKKQRKYEKNWLYNVQSPFKAPTHAKDMNSWIQYSDKTNSTLEPFYLETVSMGKVVSLDLSMQLKVKVMELLEAIVSDLTSGPSIPQHEVSFATIEEETITKLDQMTHFIQGLTEKDLDEVFNDVFEHDNERSQLAQSILTDVSSASGSATPMKKVLNLMRKRKISDVRAASILFTMTSHISTPALLQELMDYVSNLNFMKEPILTSSAVINLSNAVRKLCVDKKSFPNMVFGNLECSKEFLMAFQEVIFSKAWLLHEAWHRNIWLEAVTRLGTNDTFKTLDFILSNYPNASDPVLKLTAVRGLVADNWKHRPDIKYKAVRILQGVAFDTRNKIVVRMNAIKGLLSWNPSASLWYRLAQMTYEEKSTVLASFIYFLIRDVAESLDPEYYTQSAMAQAALPFSKKFSNNSRYAVVKFQTDFAFYNQILESYEMYWLPGKLKEFITEIKIKLGGYDTHFFNFNADLYGDIWTLLTRSREDEWRMTQKSYVNVIIKLLNNMEEFIPMTYYTLQHSIGIGGNVLLRHLHEKGAGFHMTKFLRPIYREVFVPSSLGLPVIAKFSSPLLIMNEGHLKIDLPDIADMTFQNMWDSLQVEIPFHNNMRIMSKVASSISVLFPWSDSSSTAGVENVKRIIAPLRGKLTQSIDSMKCRTLCVNGSSTYIQKIPVIYGHNAPYTSIQYLWPRKDRQMMKTFKFISVQDNQQPTTQSRPMVGGIANVHYTKRKESVITIQYFPGISPIIRNINKNGIRSQVQEKFDINFSTTGISGSLFWKADKQFPFTYGNALEFLRHPAKLVELVSSPTTEFWQMYLLFEAKKSENKNYAFCIYYGKDVDFIIRGNADRKKYSDVTRSQDYKLLRSITPPSQSTSSSSLLYTARRSKRKEELEERIYHNKIIGVQFVSSGTTEHSFDALFFLGDELNTKTLEAGDEMIVAFSWTKDNGEEEQLKTTAICFTFRKLYRAIMNMSKLKSELKSGIISMIEALYVRGEECIGLKPIAYVMSKMEVSKARRKMILNELLQSCNSDPFDPTVSCNTEAVYDNFYGVVHKEENLTKIDADIFRLGEGLFWLFSNPRIHNDYLVSNSDIDIYAERPLDSDTWSAKIRLRSQTTSISNIKIPRSVEGIVFHEGFSSTESSVNDENERGGKIVDRNQSPRSVTERRLGECVISYGEMVNFAGQHYKTELSDCFTMTARLNNSENGLVLVKDTGYLQEQGIQARVVNAVDNVVDISENGVKVNGKNTIFTENFIVVKDKQGKNFCTVSKRDNGFVVNIFNGVEVKVSKDIRVTVPENQHHFVSGLCGRFSKTEANIGPLDCVYLRKDIQLFIYAWTIPVGRLCNLEDLWNHKQMVQKYQQHCKKNSSAFQAEPEGHHQLNFA